MQIFGDWVGVLMINRPEETARWMEEHNDIHASRPEDPKSVVATFALWNYVRGTFVGVRPCQYPALPP